MRIAECKCGNEFATQKKEAKYCSNKCKYTFRIRPRGLSYILKSKNKGWFKKGEAPYQHLLKGRATWNKGLGCGYINMHDYRVWWINGEEILEHRLVIEKLLNRKLSSQEIVHHKNHDRKNNEINNLQIMTRSEHSRLHNAERLTK